VSGYLLDVTVWAAEVGAVPNLPWWARLLGWCLGICG